MGFHGVLGHEFVGVVEEVNADEETKKKWVGKRVCGDINVGCADCNVCKDVDCLDARCSKMSRNHCPNRTVLGILNRNGTFAEYLTLPVALLHLVPDVLSDEIACFAEPLSAALRVAEQDVIFYGDPRPDRVAILGDGKLTLMIAEVLGRAHAKHFGDKNVPKPVLFSNNSKKQELVQDTAGVVCKPLSECKDSSTFNGVAKEHAAKYDVVVEATETPAGLTLAAGMCRPMGTLILKTTCAAGEKFNAAPFVIDELSVIGSRCGPIDKALEMLAETQSQGNPLPLEKYVTKTFPLDQADEAVKCAMEEPTVQVQIICASE